MSTAVPVSPRSALAYPLTLWIAWAASRLIGLAIVTQGTGAHPELDYYLDIVSETEAPEYPVPLLVPLTWIYALGPSTQPEFGRAFVYLVLIIDGLITAFLIHFRNPRANAAESHTRRLCAVGFWILFGLSAGPSMYMRLDIFPAVLVGGALALMAQHPRSASALLGLATSLKLWPGILAAGLVGRWSDRASWYRLASFAAALLGMAGLVAVINGPERLISPLGYQGDRGLQIESIAATPLIINGYQHPDHYYVGLAVSKSYEIEGPGVDAALTFASIGTAVTLLLAVAWACYRLFAGRWSARSTAHFSIAILLLLLATNKVFSPQYMVWLGPAVAVTLLQPWTTRRGEELNGTPAQRYRSVRGMYLIAAAVIVAMGLTTYVYPFAYDEIAYRLGGEWAPVAALTIRNALILAAAIGAFALVVVDEHNERPASASNPEETRKPATPPTVPEQRDKNRLALRFSAWRRSVSNSPDTTHKLGTPGKRDTQGLTRGIDWAAVALITFAGSAIRLLFLALMAAANGTSLADELGAWDTEYYLAIAKDGYFDADIHPEGPPHHHTLAFFPAIPMMIRAIHSVTLMSPAVAGFALNFVFLFFATAAVFALADRMKASRFEAFIGAVAVTCAPLTIVFHMPYTEALFMALSFWALVAMVDKRWIVAGVFVTLTGFVRLTAVDLIAVFGLMVLLQARKNWKAWIAVAVSALPIAGYLGWANRHLAEMGGYFGIQAEFWNSEFDYGVRSVTWVIERMLTGEDLASMFAATSMVVVPLLVAVTWKRIPWAVWFFSAAIATNVLLSDGIMSSRPRLLLPTAILLLPVVMWCARKLGARPVILLSGGWVLFSAWYSAHMLAVFPHAI
ncbi:Mannosyltransferase (PIG-V) [Corynebacterium glaucum]|uniref:mannosyltransferase family protein n=1 Tax=Corynebacterium glaucum TaxID=187491 RepID=UPI0025B5E2B4|nr:mannosyltransferase family protein [Corynebacterium glaucum]WJZ07170.1 Mannosyltransferase (PIG-V) [Corynebacterium glaucum]